MVLFFIYPPFFYGAAVFAGMAAPLCVITGDSMEFNYNSKKWKRKAAHIMRRDGYMCVLCKRYGKMRPAQVVHHIQHVDEYPKLAYIDSNLESLCVACHAKMHPEKGRKGLYARYKM